MRGLLLVLIWTLLGLPAAIVVLPWTLLARDTRVLLRVGFWITRAGLPLVGIRVVLRGVNNVPHGAAILMANHTSNLDPPAFLPNVPGRVVIYLKASLMKIPILGAAMRLAGFIPVQRDGSVESAKASGAAALNALAQGARVVVFPEGTRSRDGRLLPFKKGPFFLAMDSGAPVVPVTITGTHQMLPKGSVRLRKGAVTVTFHPALLPGEFADREALMAAVRAWIESGLNLEQL